MRKPKLCRHCGEPITLIKITRNRTILCDAKPVAYWKRKNGTQTIITADGEVVTAVLCGKIKFAADIGYTPHKPHCTGRTDKGGRK